MDCKLSAKDRILKASWHICTEWLFFPDAVWKQLTPETGKWPACLTLQKSQLLRAPVINQSTAPELRETPPFCSSLFSRKSVKQLKLGPDLCSFTSSGNLVSHLMVSRVLFGHVGFPLKQPPTIVLTHIYTHHVVWMLNVCHLVLWSGVSRSFPWSGTLAGGTCERFSGHCGGCPSQDCGDPGPFSLHFLDHDASGLLCHIVFLLCCVTRSRCLNKRATCSWTEPSITVIQNMHFSL